MPEIKTSYYDSPLQWRMLAENIGQASLAESAERFYRYRGRDLYELPSISAMNRLPIAELSDWILDEAEWESGRLPDEWTLDDLVERRLVEGAMVLHDSSEGIVFIERLIETHPHFLLQRVDACPPEKFFDYHERDAVVREYKEAGGAWEILDFTGYGSKDQALFTDHAKHKIEPPADIPVSQLYVFPWGRGVLEPNGYTYQRLERIARRLDQYSDPTNNALYFTGLSSPEDKAMMTQAAQKKASKVYLPKGTEVARHASAELSAIMLEEKTGLTQDYFAAIGIVRVSETADLSGVARMTAMKRMFRTVAKIRQDIDDLLETFGGSVEWPMTAMLSTAEMAALLDLYLSLYRNGAMGYQELMEAMRKLAGLQGAVPSDRNRAIDFRAPEERAAEQLAAQTNGRYAPMARGGAVA